MAKKTDDKPKGMAHNIPVYCSHDMIVLTEDLIKNPRNPNTHPQNQIEALAKIIQKQGWRAPITVSKRSGFIVKGHGRLEAAIFAGLNEVPVDYQSYENEAAEWADLVADNRLSELSTMNNDMLNELLQEISEAEDFDFDLTGYDESILDSILEEEDPPSDFDEYDEDIETTHECPQCGYKWS